MDAEKKFWSQVRDRRLGGHKFKRQFLIGRYIVDFVCLDCKVVIELDGGQHHEAAGLTRDSRRTRWLEQQGYRVLRFDNGYALQNTIGVMDRIALELGLRLRALTRGFGDQVRCVACVVAIGVLLAAILRWSDFVAL